ADAGPSPGRERTKPYTALPDEGAEEVGGVTPTPRGKHIHSFLAGRVAGPAVPPGLSAHGVERVHVEVRQHGRDEPSQEVHRRPSHIESSGCPGCLRAL